MTDKSKRQQDIIKLEKKRQFINGRLDQQRQRFNERFDRKQAELNGVLNRKQENIVASALVLLDQEGLNSLSLRKLANKLNMQAPAIYWHFKNKENLIDYMAEAILKKQFADLKPSQASEIWQDWLISIMQKLREAMLSYTDGAKVVAGAHLYPTVSLGKIIDISMQSLTQTGMDLLDARQIVMTAMHYVFGHVIEEQSSPSLEELDGLELEGMQEEYPTISAAIEALKKAKFTEDDDFNVGIQLIINGYK
jgi:TetR/AcrR family tetracycline transcriptional repressor